MFARNHMENLFPKAAVALTLIGVAAPSAFAQRNRAITLDAGTVIPVKLEDRLSSKDNRKGDTFTAKLKVDEGSNYVGLPDGTIIEGRILSARQKSGKDAGTLELGFQRLRMPSGQSFPIEGSLIGLDGKSVNKDSDGRIVAKPGSENKRVTYAGYGAGAAALVGLLSNGRLNLGNLLLGGLLGYAAGSTQKASDNVRDVDLKQGTEMGVRLDRRTTLKYETELNDPDYDNSKYRRNDGTRRNDDRDTGGSRLDRRRTGSQEDMDTGRSNPRTSGEIGVMIGDRDVQFDSTAPPVMVDGKLMVPIIPVLKSAGIKYNTSNNGIQVMGRDSTVRASIGSKVATDSDRRVKLDVAPRRMNGTIYVPAKFVEIATGYKANWDSGTKTLLLDE